MKLVRKLRPQRGIATILVIALALSAAACPFGTPKPSDVEQAERQLNRVANALNAMAKTNRELYQRNVINKDDRRMAASIINKANGYVDQTIDLAYSIDLTNEGDLSAGKAEAEKLLNRLIDELNLVTTNQELRLAAQGVIALVGEAKRTIKAIRSTARKVGG